MADSHSPSRLDHRNLSESLTVFFVGNLPCLWEEAVVNAKVCGYSHNVKLTLLFPLSFVHIIYKNAYPLFLPEGMCLLCIYVRISGYMCTRKEKGSVLVLSAIIMIFLQVLFVKLILRSWSTGGVLRISFNSSIIKALTTLNVYTHLKVLSRFLVAKYQWAHLSVGVCLTDVTLLL